MNSSLKTILWRTAFGVAIIILLASGFYSEENARGHAAWNKAKREAAAKGISLDWNDYIPATVPDSSNFYTAPMMTEWFVRASDHAPAVKPTGAPLTTLLENPDTDIDDITAKSANDYLAWCSTVEPQFNQIRDALKRPAARIDGDYSVPFREPSPNYVSYRMVGKVLGHEAKCHLILGQTDKALADLTLLHNFDETLVKNTKSNTLVQTMIYAVIVNLYANAISCGLDSRAWHEPELLALQMQLATIHLPELLANTYLVEGAGGCGVMDYFDLSSATGREFFESKKIKTPSDFGVCFIPRGWIDLNRATIADLEIPLMGCINLTNQTVSPSLAKAGMNRVEDTFRKITPENYFAQQAVPNMAKTTMAVARFQTRVDQTLIACALERYRLANGKYPAALAALVPQYLEKIPHDVITGTPMKYVRKDYQNFLLYSVGWNETDEGGIIVRNSKGEEDRESGDWVWHYPKP